MNASQILWIDLRYCGDRTSSRHCLRDNMTVLGVEDSENLDFEVRKFSPVVICFEFDYPDISSLSVLQRAKASFTDMPVIMITEHHSEALATWALRAHLWDYFVKPLQPNELSKSISTVFSQLQLENPLPPEVRFRPRQKNRTYPAKFYVESNYHESIRETQVAHLCGMNASTFSRQFKKEHGVTFRDYLVSYRISKAQELLHNPNASVTDIAYTVGFQDPSYFTRRFRNSLGMSPSCYREAKKLH